MRNALRIPCRSMRNRSQKICRDRAKEHDDKTHAPHTKNMRGTNQRNYPPLAIANHPVGKTKFARRPKEFKRKHKDWHKKPGEARRFFMQERAQKKNQCIFSRHHNADSQ